jgi:hypothetical protein
VADLIDIGIAPNDHTGDDFRTVCLKLNAYLSLLAVRNQSLIDQSALTAFKAQIDLLISGKLDNSIAALSPLFDSLPMLPASPANYPTQGGWFRDGDANGYRLVRIYPAS